MTSRLIITIGDPAGIGPEITIKALDRLAGTGETVPIVIGDRCVMDDAIRLTGSHIQVVEINATQEAENKPGILNLINLDCLHGKLCPYGQVSAEGGDRSHQQGSRASGRS